MTARKGGVRTAVKALGTVGSAMAVSSLLGYVLLAGVARWLTEADFAVFLSTWGVIFGLGSALSVVEQEVSRQSAAAKAVGARTGRSSLQILTLAAVVAVAVSVGIALSPLGESVYGGYRSIAILTCLATVGFGPQFFVRGLLVGHGRLRPYAAVLVIEPVLRLVVAGALALALTSDRLVPMVLAVVTGSFAWLFVVLGARGLVDVRSGGEPWGRVSRRVLVLGSASALTACLLTGYPAIVTAVVGSTEGLATLFTVITATRVPLILVSPVQALAVPAVVRLVYAGKTRELRSYLVKGMGALAVTAALGAVGGALLGPWAVRVFFGAQYEASPLMVAILLASTVVIAGILLQAAALLALQRYGSLLLTWGTAVVAALVVLAAWPGAAPERGTAGLAVAALVGCAVGTAQLARATRSH